MSKPKTLRLTLPAVVGSLVTLDEAVDELGLERDWGPGVLFQVKLALEELALNIIQHGYGESGHEFDVMIDSGSRSLTIELVDDAPAFNPLEDAPAPETDASVEDRKLGGLGVYLVREMMDEVRYARSNGKNRLTLVKRGQT